LGTHRRVLTQVYPTYKIFDNLVSTEPQLLQAERPIMNFFSDPYPPGDAPFIRPRD